jgi:hypothetical protein
MTTVRTTISVRMLDIRSPTTKSSNEDALLAYDKARAALEAIRVEVGDG